MVHQHRAARGLVQSVPDLALLSLRVLVQTG